MTVGAGARPAESVLDDVVVAQHTGVPRGVTSVCSSHPFVLEAAVRQAVEDGSVVLVEATSNQVDQYGGYTGLRPAEFRDLVLELADRCDLPRRRVLLGGDHLGTNRWRSQPPADAMREARDLVAAYVRAGYRKIHLDCSYPCAGDPVPLTDDIVSERAADLLVVAEAAAAETGQAGALRYVIGTEVPVPGGADHALHDLVPTAPEAARATLAAHRSAFAARGLDAVWPRVVGLVVQPGVEFDAQQVVDYRSADTRELREVLRDEPGMVFEAHSTDYQTVAGLTDLVTDHWAVLKVGPWLTFAMREALFALSAVERELVPPDRQSRLPEVLEQVMLEQPGHWKGYYDRGQMEQHVARRYSYSDRMRYYWPDPRVEAATQLLLENLGDRTIPLPLLSAHLPVQHARVRTGRLTGDPRALVVDAIRDVLRGYAAACRTGSSHPFGPSADPTTSGQQARTVVELPGAGATGREIAQQPQLWRAVAGTVAAERAALEAFLAPLLARPHLRVLLTGAGTSAFVGQVLAPALSRRLGRVVEAVATTDLVSAPREHFPVDVPTLLVSFARSGDSPESVAATRLAEQCSSEVHHLVVTCNADGRLARDHAGVDRSLVLRMPEAANDRGFAMTSSFTCMLLAAFLALDGDLPADHVERLAEAGQHVMDEALPVVRALAARHPPSVVYLGSGALKGLAEESALKLLELTTGAITVTADSPLAFRHGPKAVLAADTVVVVYLSDDRYTRAYDLDLVRELRAQMGGGQVFVVDGAAEPDPSLGEGPRIAVPGLTDLGDVVLAVAAAPFPQLMGLVHSLALGRTPDNPFPDGEVNRVVQGVAVHPLED